jgi:hypothetical protein
MKRALQTCGLDACIAGAAVLVCLYFAHLGGI